MADVNPTVTNQSGGQNILFAQATIDFANTAAQSQSAGVTVAVTGARTGDAVAVTPQTNLTTGVFHGVVSAADEVTAYFNNFSSGAVNPASAVYTIAVTRQAR